MTTKRDLYEKALIALGYTKVYTRSSKYIAYFKNDLTFKSGDPCFIFLGSRGAFRLGAVASKSWDAPANAANVLRRFAEGDF